MPHRQGPEQAGSFKAPPKVHTSPPKAQRAPDDDLPLFPKQISSFVLQIGLLEQSGRLLYQRQGPNGERHRRPPAKRKQLPLSRRVVRPFGIRLCNQLDVE